MTAPTLVTGSYGLTKFGQYLPDAGQDTFITYVDERGGGEGTPITANDLNHIQDAVLAVQRESLDRLESYTNIRSAHSTELSPDQVPTNAVKFWNPIYSRYDTAVELNFYGMFPYYDGTYSIILVPVHWKASKDTPVLTISTAQVRIAEVLQTGWSSHSLQVNDHGGLIGARKNEVPSLTNGGYHLKLIYSVTGS